MRKVATISINLTAGTSEFLVQMDRANAKIKEFGRSGGEFGRPMISEARATTAAMKSLEGQFFNNTRAADKFLESVLHAGPILQAAFPIFGAVALGGAITEVGKKLFEFYKNIAEAPERIAASFRTLNAPLRLTNDELQLTNDRLANDIAKLEGRHQNTLKIMLDEARVAADKLADSLDKDLVALQELLKKEDVGWMRQALGEAGTGDLGKELKHFMKETGDIEDEGAEKLAKATDKKSKDAAQTELNTKLLAKYAAALAAVNKEIEQTRKPTMAVLPLGMPFDLSGVKKEDTDARLNQLRGIRDRLQGQMTFIGRTATNESLTEKKTDLETANANAALGRPFEDKLKSISQQIGAVTEKLRAIGQPESAQILAKAFGDAGKAILEVNKQLEAHHTHLTPLQAAQIRQATLTLATVEAQEQWKKKLSDTSTTIQDEIRSQDLLTAAIGKGYEATKKANVESQLMALMKDKYTDPAFAADRQKLGGELGAKFDAKNAEQKSVAIEKLQEQIELEKALALAQARGAEAVREATLALKLKKIEADNDAESAKKLMAAEIELFNAQKANTDAATISKLQERIAATQRLTDAILGGAEAERQAALENKYAEMARGGASPQAIATERQADQADHQQKITQEALKTGLEYQNHIELLTQQIDALEKIKATRGDTMAIEISLRDLENQRIEAVVQETLKLRDARDGVKAFFMEMQTDAKSAASIVYDAMHSALDRSSSELAKLFTGQKTNFGKMFQEIGTQMVQSSIKSMMQQGLGALGKVFGIPELKRADGQSESTAFWVQIAQGGLMPAAAGAPGLPGAPGVPGIPRVFGSGAAAGGLIFSLMKMFGRGGSGSAAASSGESVDSTISFDSPDMGPGMASGGEVTPGTVYPVGEQGPEMFAPSTPGRIIPAGQIGGGHTFTYNIDARGTDAVLVERRTRAAIIAAHNSAISNAVVSNQELSKRTPQQR